jgi:alkaline phosphatase
MPGCGDIKKMAKIKPGETVFFSFIIYKNKAHRNKVNKAVLEEMKTQKMPTEMPFDAKRMAYGGFKAIIKA